MNCPDPETLARYRAGTLPAEEAEGVRQHLNDCPACAALAAVPAPPPSDEPAVAATTFRPTEEALAGPAAEPHAAAITPRPDCPSRDELRGYLEGALAPERRTEVRDHVAECDDCFETIRELRHGVGAPTPLVPDEVVAAMPAFTRTAPRSMTGAAVEPAPVIAPFRQVLSHTAVAVAAVAITLTLAASGHQETPRERLMRLGSPPGYTGGPRPAQPEPDQSGGMTQHSMGPGGMRPGGPGAGMPPGGMGSPGQFGRRPFGIAPGGGGMMPGGPGLSPGRMGMPGMNSLSSGSPPPGGFGSMMGGPRPGTFPGRMPPMAMGSAGMAGMTGMTGARPPHPGTPVSTGATPSAPAAAAPPNLDALLPVRRAPVGAGVSGELPGTPEAAQMALREAADLARSRGAAAAAAKLEEFAHTPANQTPEVYTFLGTLYMKMGDRDRAAQALAEAQRRLEPPKPTATPDAPTTPGGTTPATPGGSGG